MSKRSLNIVADIDSIPLPRPEVWLPAERVRSRSGAWRAAAIGSLVAVAFIAAVVLPALDTKESGAGRAPTALCAQDDVRKALLRAAQAWASGDSGLLSSLLASDGQLTFEDGRRNTGLVTYSTTEIPGYLAARVPRVEDLILGRVEPEYSVGPDVVLLHAFVIRDGLDYPVLFVGARATCSPGAVFSRFSVALGAR